MPYTHRMEPGGDIHADLKAALGSIRRLRGHPVHADTLRYWHDLVHQARREIGPEGPAREEMEALIAGIEGALAEREY